MMTMAENLRTNDRYEVHAYVDVSAPKNVLIYHRVQNLSLGGICIQTPAIREIGSLVDVVINFPELETEVAIRGQVVWANREPPQDVGIRWVNLDESRRTLLNRYIAAVATKQSDPDYIHIDDAS